MCNYCRQFLCNNCTIILCAYCMQHAYCIVFLLYVWFLATTLWWNRLLIIAGFPTCWKACNYCSALHTIIAHETTAWTTILILLFYCYDSVALTLGCKLACVYHQYCIFADTLWRVFHILTKPVPYTFVYVNRGNNAARANSPQSTLHYIRNYSGLNKSSFKDHYGDAVI